MRHAFTILLTLLCLVGQGVAMAAQQADIDHAVEGMHATLHAAQSAHHHHDDGTTHHHDEGQGSEHSHPDSVSCAALALPAASLAVAAIDPSATSVRFDEHPRPPPYLEGLRRPPRPAS